MCAARVRLIGMCLNGTKSRVRVGKQVSDIFEIHNGLRWAGHVSAIGDERGVRRILEGNPEVYVHTAMNLRVR
ncbi:hypothetical protein C0J52_17950 [Blattella germanica]|nr:hypothetical protein C0J52_17950 [Blattella germanica]